MNTSTPGAPYEDLISAGIQAREERDACSWALGDCALAAVTYYGVKLTDYARAVNEDRSRLAGLKDNAAFYKPEERADYPPNLAWWQFAEARRRSGWRPYQGDPTEAQKSFASNLLFHIAEECGGADGGRIVAELADLLDKVHGRLVYLAEKADGMPGRATTRTSILRAAEYVRLAAEREREL